MGAGRGALAGLVKSSLDRGLALAALIVLAPVMGLIALAIRLSTGEKVFFSHDRVGLGGRPFGCLKFRTMVPDAQSRLDLILASDPVARAEWVEDFKFERDSRVTRIGRILRKTSLDELPQLINVLRGDMSLVGPRPITRTEAARYGRDYQSYIRVRPGLTGLWQVSGRSDTTYDERIALDVAYVRHATLGTDLQILARTVVCVLARRGAV
ncbi:sugar transferase [Marinibacterium sp. SX1]|uniref:sugar transferase n=1 Tax=Marinibacterium sp. SX1 TaxID=3388424 RepID=UPI003D1703ED